MKEERRRGGIRGQDSQDRIMREESIQGEKAEGTEGESIRQIQRQATKVAHHATMTGERTPVMGRDVQPRGRNEDGVKKVRGEGKEQQRR